MQLIELFLVGWSPKLRSYVAKEVAQGGGRPHPHGRLFVLQENGYLSGHRFRLHIPFTEEVVQDS